MQLNSLTRWLQAISAYPWSWTLRKILLPIYDRQTSAFLDPPAGPGNVIQAASNPGAKTGAAIITVLANGILVRIPAGTNYPALVGTIAQNNFGCWGFFCDQGGNLTTAFGFQGASLAAMQLPQFPIGKAFLGFVYLNPTTAPFIGGTTNLDAANTNAVFVQATEAIDPWCLMASGSPIPGTE
jgi:hypothetical protein